MGSVNCRGHSYHFLQHLEAPFLECQHPASQERALLANHVGRDRAHCSGASLSLGAETGCVSLQGTSWVSEVRALLPHSPGKPCSPLGGSPVLGGLCALK